MITDRAIDILHEHGWVRGQYHDLNGRYCVMGALRRAAITRDEHGRFRSLGRKEMADAQLALLQLLNERHRKHGGVPSVEAWNDQWAEGIDEVIEVLKLTGERLCCRDS